MADSVFPEAAWHEDIGPVLWWHLDDYGAISEPPVVACGGAELEYHQSWDGYYSHWSLLPVMRQYPVRELKLAPMGTLICDWG